MLGKANVPALKAMMGHANVAAPKGTCHHGLTWTGTALGGLVSSATLHSYRDKGSHGTKCLGSTKFAHTGLLSFVLFGNRNTD